MKHGSKVTFFSRTTSGQVKVWSCWIQPDGITVTSTWGLKGGAVQRTSDTMKVIGRKSATQVAIEEHARRVQKKQRAGYQEKEDQARSVLLEKQKVDLNFDRLPRSFAPAKPVREISSDEATRLDRLQLLYKQRKRDGMRFYLVTGLDGTLRVLSRGLDDLTDHFARLTQELSLPPGSVLDAEFVVTTQKGADDFIAVSEICRSKADRAKRTMITKEHTGSVLNFFVFDLLFYDRLPTWQLPYEKRYAALLEALEKAHRPSRTRFNHVVPMPLLPDSLDGCIRKVQKQGWEGLVLWRMDHSTLVRLNGTPARCNAYKFKPMREDDFVATGFELGKGKNAKVVGALNIAAYDGPTLRPLGNVGGGLDDQAREESLHWRYPCVVQVKYEKRSETGLRFPSFLRKREDKKPRECTLT